jgi:predicted transport protein
MKEHRHMSDIKLFRTDNGTVEEMKGTSVAVEKSLQRLIEQHLEVFLGIRLLASEHNTGKVHGGRIDTLGIDENGYPVIIEYKRALNENVINQGLFYLDWLMDHKADFKLLVMDRFGKDQSNSIEWNSPRLLCIAGDFTNYDEHAVKQIPRNIELIRYRRYGDRFLLFELVNVIATQSIEDEPITISTVKTKGKYTDKTVIESLAESNQYTRDRFEAIQAFLLALGDDVQIKTLKLYVAFKRIKNFTCLEIQASTGVIRAFVKVNPDTITIEYGFTRDVRMIGHWGTGDLEITIRNDDDFERAKPLLLKGYEAS